MDKIFIIIYLLFYHRKSPVLRFMETIFSHSKVSVFSISFKLDDANCRLFDYNGLISHLKDSGHD